MENGRHKKGTVLEEAKHLICGPRNTAYGDPLEDFSRTVALFNAATGKNLSPAEGILFMVCVKISREMHRHQRDNLVDLAGYVDLYSYAVERTERARYVGEEQKAE